MITFENYLQTNIVKKIHNMTVPSSDDGETFTDRTRLTVIEEYLQDSTWELLKDLPLAKIYCRKNLNKKLPVVIISAHIDSVQEKYYSKETNQHVNGTYDNSACVAILTRMMCGYFSSDNVIVAFTGNEEKDMKGANQVSKYIKKTPWLKKACNCVISLDLTNESYRKKDYTIENIYPFSSGSDDIKDILPEAEIISECAPDDSWAYMKHKLPCFTLCLPCKNLGEDMHSLKGVRIKKSAIWGYMKALEKLVLHLC